MAFLADGRWLPDQPMSNGPAPQISNGAPNMLNNGMPISYPQAPMMTQQMPGNPFAQNMGFNPNFKPNFGSQPTSSGISNNPGAQAINQSMQGQQPMQQGLVNYPNQQGTNAQPSVDMTPLNTYAPMQQKIYPPSLTQSVNMSDPQARQNYLNALHNSPQAAQNNAWRNPYGMQGQQAQAGFQGFQQNGQAPQGSMPNQYKQPQQGQQLGSAANKATSGGAYTAQPGIGGVPGQPSFQMTQPAPVGTPVAPLDPKKDPTEKISNPHKEVNNGLPNDPYNNRAASDINSKQNITPGSSQLQEFLDSLGVYDYEYKDPKYGDGRRISPMAQEIEQTPIGKAAISTNEEGYKIVDYGKLGGTMLAGLAHLNHEHQSLEQMMEQKYKKLESQLKESIMLSLKKKEKR